MSTLQYMRDIISDRIQNYSNSQTKEDKKTLEQEPYHNLQKSAVLQESRCFNESQIHDKKCRQILTKLIYLINQGEIFNETETQTLFFGITKLFQSNNQDLRRMIYLMIKEFRHENSMYVVISCLTKDINSKNDLFRMNALRTLPLVLDQSNLVQLDRYLKNAILDKAQPISSAALIAGLQIFRISPDFIRKWANEVADRLNSKYPQNGFHALLLLHEIKNNDKITFTKILLQLTKENLVPIGNMQIIRFIKEILPEVDQNQEKQFLDYLLRQIHKSQEIVIFEACKALGEIKSLSNKDLQPMVQVISVFLVSSNVINKFVALKILNRLIANPIRRSLITSTAAIEALIQDSNKSLSSLAVSILLKICQENNIEKLLSQIFDYLADMSDEFKIDVLRSVKALVLNSPKKWRPIITFLQQTFKCEASQEFKKYAVDVIETIIHEIPEARDTAIMAIAEYIEDCQAPIQLNILTILNKEASKQLCPIKVIRIVNNRLFLEDAEIRAAAVGVLGKFYMHYPSEKAKVRQLLEAAARDPDEEVRNRSMQYMGADAESESENIITLAELDAIESYLQMNMNGIMESKDSNILSMNKILEFAENNKGKIKKSEIYEQIVEQEMIESHIEEHDTSLETYRKLFSEHAIFKQYGTLRKIVNSQGLTDSKCEYLVSVVKHLFDNHIILEYKIKNTLENIDLSDVSVELTIKNPNIQIESILPAKKIETQCASNILVGLQFNPNLRLVSSHIQTILTFTVNESAASYQDEYQVEDFHLNYNDFFQPEILKKKFQSEWEQFNQGELSATYQLDYKNTDIAVKELSKHFGLNICDQSDVIQPQNKFHTLLLGGLYLGVKQVFIICQIGFQQNIGCVLKIKCKSEDQVLSNNIIESLA